ncbi:UNVERIFIED_CONTAM: hypothetical protein K2H54_004202 [Gekko kuhli]
MALLEQEEPRDDLIINKQELVDIHKDLHRSLREAVEEIVHPLKTQLNDFIQELRDMANKTEENSRDLCCTPRGDIAHLKSGVNLTPKGTVLYHVICF